jgi:hypothetical protein
MASKYRLRFRAPGRAVVRELTLFCLNDADVLSIAAMIRAESRTEVWDRKRLVGAFVHERPGRET